MQSLLQLFDFETDENKTLLLALLLLAGLAKPLAGSLEADVQLTYPLTVKKLENIYIDARL